MSKKSNITYKPWVIDYANNLSDDLKYDIKTARYLDNITPTKISRIFKIPLYVIYYICEIEKKRIKAEEDLDSYE